MIHREKTSIAKAALRYARRGWPVLPLHSVKNGRCTCSDRECQNAGNTLTKHGVKDATTDKDVIRARWRKWPNANIGVATGARSGIVVVDIDPRHDGNLSFRRLIQQHGPLPPCPKVITGGGGRHRYFEYPGVPVKSRTAVLPDFTFELMAATLSPRLVATHRASVIGGEKAQVSPPLNRPLCLNGCSAY